jgi:hypothetical protein
MINKYYSFSLITHFWQASLSRPYHFICKGNSTIKSYFPSWASIIFLFIHTQFLFYRLFLALITLIRLSSFTETMPRKRSRKEEITPSTPVLHGSNNEKRNEERGTISNSTLYTTIPIFHAPKHKQPCLQKESLHEPGTGLTLLFLKVLVA